MEKFAVETEQPKTATKNTWNKGDCPWCGASIEVRGNVLYCPNDGTKPFETKPERVNKKR